jgi:hypothetical protein
MVGAVLAVREILVPMRYASGNNFTDRCFLR